MDPVAIGMLAKALEPFFGLIALGSIPIGILWVRNNARIRMRELDLEEKMLPQRAEARLASIEMRLASIEQALSGPVRNTLQDRAGMLEGPATTSQGAEDSSKTRVR